MHSNVAEEEHTWLFYFKFVITSNKLLSLGATWHPTAFPYCIHSPILLDDYCTFLQILNTSFFPLTGEVLGEGGEHLSNRNNQKRTSPSHLLSCLRLYLLLFWTVHVPVCVSLSICTLLSIFPLSLKDITPVILPYPIKTVLNPFNPTYFSYCLQQKLLRRLIPWILSHF